MKTNHKNYDYEKSKDRIDGYTNGSFSYEEVDEIPSRDKLTYSNGFYVKKTCSLFMDIRGSSSLPQKYQKKTLARIYRAYISEAVAIINANADFAEINIHGDAVWGVANAQYKSQVRAVLSTAAQLASMVNYLNCKLHKKGIDPISVGLGMDWGRLLMVQAGYSGSGINEVVWMGDVVNQGSKLCSYGHKSSTDWQMMASSAFYNNLDLDKDKNLFQYNYARECYHGTIVDSDMNSDLNDNGC